MRREDQLALLKSTPLDEQTINALIEAFGSPKITKDKVDDAFEKFWRWYPKRPKHSKTAAYNRFREICIRNIDPEALAHTAKEYRKDCEKHGRTGTEFVRMAATFLSKRDPLWQEFMPKGEEHKWSLEPKYDPLIDLHPAIKKEWRHVCSALLAEFGEATYKAYFDKLMLTQFADGIFTASAGSAFMANKISMEYGNRLSDIAGCPVRVVS